MQTIQYDVRLCQTRREYSGMRWSNKGMRKMNEINKPYIRNESLKVSLKFAENALNMDAI